MPIVGGGVIGMEFASFYASLGTDVTVVELLDRLLPGTGDFRWHEKAGRGGGNLPPGEQASSGGKRL
ncbi:MAG: NAD-binding protein [Anaerotruncus massiliensis (ex Togo et al. 2019)]